MRAIITKEEFLNSTIELISQVYSGDRNCCRCGCRGEYTATTFMKNPRNIINDSLVGKRLKRAKALVNKGADVNYGNSYVDIETGNNRTLTFYFNEV